MTLGAPGGNAGLLVVDGNGSYNWAQGTRMAAPTTTGIVALMVQKNGGPMHPAQVLLSLQASSPDLGKPGNDEMYGMGLVNAWRVVRSLARRAARALMS